MVADDAFPGEPFLLDAPPNYSHEWSKIKAKLVLTVAFFVIVVPAVVVPLLFSTKSAAGGGGCEVERERKADRGSEVTTDGRGRGHANGAAAGVDAAAVKRRRPHGGRRGKKKAIPGGGGDFSTAAAAADGSSSKSEATKAPVGDDSAPVVAVPALFMPATNLLCLLSMFLIVANSPNNRYAAKHVFHAPLLTSEECDRIMEMAHGAAERNYHEAIEGDAIPVLEGNEKQVERERKLAKDGRRIVDEPRGWRKDRHSHYPTTDLNLVTEQFTAEDREWIGAKLDARLSPLIERVYGITPGAIRANDVFVVRYDGDVGQQALRVHKDSSHVSFNVLLNEEFEGGGTRYHEIRGGKAWDLKPNRGEVLLNNALVLHEGLAVTSGTRYIMVGFMNVDTKDPLTEEPIPGISPFATWLCAPWNIVRFKGGVEAAQSRIRKRRADPAGDGITRWTDNKYLVSLFDDIQKAFSVIMDLWAPFAFTQLVSDENKTEYFAALDEADEARRKAAGGETDGGNARSASWFKGQQLDVDIDGSVASLWKTRREAGEGKFADL